MCEIRVGRDEGGSQEMAADGGEQPRGVPNGQTLWVKSLGPTSHDPSVGASSAFIP